jgi:hypothetical protein
MYSKVSKKAGLPTFSARNSIMISWSKPKHFYFILRDDGKKTIFFS